MLKYNAAHDTSPYRKRFEEVFLLGACCYGNRTGTNFLIRTYCLLVLTKSKSRHY